MFKLRFLPAFVLAAVLLALPATVSANTDVSSIAFQGNATLLTDPGPIDVTLHYACPPTVAEGGIVVEVIEGSVDASTPNPVPATCDGNNHSVTVEVDGLYVPGDAEGIAVLEDQSPTANGLQGVAVADQQISIK
jgi:hypothetical protein